MKWSFAPMLALFGLLCLAGCGDPSRRAIVDKKGLVLACFFADEFHSPKECLDRKVILVTLQPIAAAVPELRTATGTVIRKPSNTFNPEYCPDYLAVRDKVKDRIVKAAVEIRIPDRSDEKLRQAIGNILPNRAGEPATVQEAFTLDLDGDGALETVFFIDDVAIATREFEMNEKSLPYTVAFGIISETGEGFLRVFESDYFIGGTDAIPWGNLVGIVPLDDQAKIWGIVVHSRNIGDGDDTYYRYAKGRGSLAGTVNDYFCP